MKCSNCGSVIVADQPDGTLRVITRGLVLNVHKGTVRVKCRSCKSWEPTAENPLVKALCIALAPGRAGK